MVDFPGENAEEVLQVESNATDDEKDMITAVEVETPVEEQAQEVLETAAEEEKDSEDADSDKDTE